MPIEKRTFEKGMNQDLAESLLAPGMYRYALNIRNGNSEKGAEGAITNAEGNREVSVTLPSGSNRVIGAMDDEPNDRVIYIVYNSAGNNRILAYDYKAAVVKTIYSDSGNILNLNSAYLVTAMNVIQGESTTYLLFTDNYGEPKNIDIEQGTRTYDTNLDGSSEYIYRRLLGDYDTVSPSSTKKDYVYSREIRYTDEDGNPQDVTYYYRATAFTNTAPTASTADTTPNNDWEVCPAGYVYGNLTEESITAIVAPPTESPRTSYASFASDQNHLYGNLYQFKAKYVRADGRESAWSPVSYFIDPAYLPDSFLTVSSFENLNGFSNAIVVNVPIPDKSIYKTIKIAVRRNMSDKSPDDWQLAGVHDVVDELLDVVYTDSLSTRFVFDGSTSLMPLDTNSAIQIMSWIPRKAKAQAVTSKNRILYANFTEGRPYDKNSRRGLNQNPPLARFFERDNPYNTTSTLGVYKYNGTTINASVITEETEFDPPIESVSGIAIKFPNPLTENVLYTLRIECGYAYSLDGGEKSEHVDRTLKAEKRAQSTATTDVLDYFVDFINENNVFWSSIGLGFDFNSYLCSATSASSGGSEYLILVPAASAQKSAGEGNDFSTIELYPQIRKVPIAKEGVELDTIQSFKRGTTQKFALAYSDAYGRVSTAIEHTALNVTNPWWRNSSVSAATASGIAGNIYADIGQRYLELRLANDAPSWATSYHVLKSSSNGIRNSVSFPIAKITGLPTLSDGSTNPLDGKYFYRGYLRQDYTTAYSALTASAASLDGTTFLYIPLHSLQSTQFGYANLNDAPLAYDFSRGDRIRFCYTKSPTTEADYFQADADAEIIGYSNELNCVIVRTQSLPDSLVGTSGPLRKANEDGSVDADIRGLLVEIYSPDKEQAAEFYYEVYTDSVSADTANSRYYHLGNTQNQSSATTAIVEIDRGDCFLKPRTYVWLGTDADVAAATSAETYYVEEVNYYDKTPSNTWGAGRPNRIIRSTSQAEDISGFLGEVKRPTTIRYSEPFAPEQGYNGLGTIYDLNFKDANPTKQSIQHLHSEGSRTIIFHEDAVGWAESDRAVITTLDGNNMTIGANTPLSDIVYYGTRAGIGLNPESFAFNNYRKYFVDVDQGQVCRLSNDGVTVISDAKMNKYFKSVFRNMITSPEQDYAYGAYDKRTDEYTLTLKWNTEVSATSLSGISISESGADLTWNLGDTSGYDLYVGGFVRLYVPEYEISAAFYDSYDQLTQITAVTATGVTLDIPTANESLFEAILLDRGTAYTMYLYPYSSSTLTFNERLKAWTSFHSFNAENLASAGMDFASFRAGKLYIHDDYDNPHSYYGTDFPAYIDMISNMGGDQVKIWKTMALKATTEDAEVDETDFVVAVSSADTSGAVEAITGGVEDSRGKISTGTTFVLKEGQLYSDYMRTGTGTTYSDFIEGDKVRGYWVYTRFKINSGISKIYKIISASFDFLMSNYTR
jgi:hypothetical protein